MYTSAAVQAKEQEDTMFMTQPRMPVSLTENISRKDTITDTATEVIGPQSRPPNVITTSLGSYFRNMTTGNRATSITT